MKLYDENLLVVSAIEEFAVRHNLPEAVATHLLRELGALSLIRKNWDALHTQGIDEAIEFVEDYIQNHTLDEMITRAKEVNEVSNETLSR